ncbi:MAG TPA: hypothetical protein VI112_03130, partial [Bacteroidia bacterium]
MKRNILFCFVLTYFISCKTPMPIYFDKPVGKVIDSFPVIMRGNFLIVNAGEMHNTMLDNGKYEISNDTIFFSAYLQAKRDSIDKRLREGIP